MNKEDHSLSDTRHEEIRAQHKARLVDTCSEAKLPKVIILAGQPGAGKSGLRNQALQHFPEDEPPTIVDIDRLRESHPEYQELLAKQKKEKDYRSAASDVQYDASNWGKELIADAREGRRNLIIDGTLKSPDKAEELCKRFKRDGYHVEVHAIAVRYEDSWLSVEKRYHQAIAEGRKILRWVSKEVHDEAYEGMGTSLERLNSRESEDRIVDQIKVYRRTFNDEKGPRLLSDGAPGDTNPALVLNDRRSQPRTPEEQTDYEDTTREVRDMILEQDPDLKVSENKAFVERASKIVPGENQIAETDGIQVIDPG